MPIWNKVGACDLSGWAESLGVSKLQFKQLIGLVYQVASHELACW
jgi:hypothetical protein